MRGNHVDGESYGLRVRFEDCFVFLLSFLSVCSPVFLFLFLFFSHRKGRLATPTATEGRSESPTCLRMRDNGALMAPLDDGALQVDGFARRLQRVRLFLRSLVLYRPWIPGEHRRGTCAVECVAAHLRGFEEDSRSEVVFWIMSGQLSLASLVDVAQLHYQTTFGRTHMLSHLNTQGVLWFVSVSGAQTRCPTSWGVQALRERMTQTMFLTSSGVPNLHVE